MHTLERVLEITKMDANPYCKLYKGFRYCELGLRYCGEGWLSELDLDSESKIEMYSVGADQTGKYLILCLA